ncbi:MAG: hypothetical protein EOM10_00270 [Opitutae bacterium]|nr:hypothetical protein [Opitutae bacterium]
MSDTAGHELRQVILAKFQSVHAFCRTHPELTRSTVYQALNDTYPGNASRQLTRIRAALADSPEPTAPAVLVPDQETLEEVLQASRCRHCRRPDRRGCRGCRLQTRRDAQALREFLEVHDVGPETYRGSAG